MMHFAQRHHVLLIFSPPIDEAALFNIRIFFGKDELNFPQLQHLIEDPTYDITWYFKADSPYRLYEGSFLGEGDFCVM